jgi:hypothetical protein
MSFVLEMIGDRHGQERSPRRLQFHNASLSAGVPTQRICIFAKARKVPALGRRDIWMVPLLFVAAFMADLINRQINLPWVVEFISVALIGGGYSTALAFLKSSRIRFDPGLSSTRDLLLLMLVAAASAAFVASTYVGVAIAAGLLSIKDFAPATLRYWIGDVVGILALTPFALFLLTDQRILPLSIETALQCTGIPRFAGTRIPAVLRAFHTDCVDGGAQWNRRRRRGRSDNPMRPNPGCGIVP